MLENFNYESYRSNLAKNLKEKRIESKEFAKDFLDKEKRTTDEYNLAKFLHNTVEEIKHRKVENFESAPIFESEVENINLDANKYKEIASRLEEEHKEQVGIDTLDFIDGLKNEKTISTNLSKFPREVLENYVGHGVRNSDNNLAAVISIFENNFFIGEVGHLISGYEHCPAYTHGDFLIISHKNRGLMEDGTSGVRVDISGKKYLGTKIDQGVAFVCNLPFDSLVDDLRRMFPSKKILHAYELVDYINEEEGMNSKS